MIRESSGTDRHSAIAPGTIARPPRMRDALHHHEPPPFHGRKAELESLQRVVQSMLLLPTCATDVCTMVSDATAPTTSSTGDDSTSIGNQGCVALDNKDETIRHDGRWLLITGPRGSGKRSLGREVLRRLQNQSCRCSKFLQISGHFRRRKQSGNSGENQPKNNPYARSREWDFLFTAFQDAIRELVDVIIHDVELTHAVLEQVNHSLNDTKDVALLTQAFPCTKKLLYLEARFVPLHPNRDAPAANVYCCVHLHETPTLMERCVAVRRAVTALLQAVSVCLPVVLRLDDLQNADAESLALIELILLLNPSKHVPDSSERLSSKGVLILATCVMDIRASPLSHDLRTLLQPGGDSQGESLLPIGCYRNEQQHSIHHFALSNLTREEVHEWTVHWIEVGKIPQCSPKMERSITDLVFHHSNGNPFHLQYLFRFLELDQSGLTKLLDGKKSIPSTIPELFTSILLQQDASVANLVQCAATLSLLEETDTSVIDCEILRIAVRQPCGDEVLKAQAEGLLDFFPARGYVQFSRSELQMAAYSTIADAPGWHFTVGRSLWNDAFLLHDQKNKVDDEIKRKLLLAILHMRNCLDFVTDFDERIHMSQLCYEYGLAVSLTGDFATSSKLFEFAICVLGTEIWRPDLYETSLVLHNAAVQTYLYIGHDSHLEKALDAIFTNAKCFNDKLSAYITSVYARAKHQMKDGFRIASFVSSELGEPIDPNPGTLAILKSKLHLTWTLLGKTDNFLANLPEASENNLIIAHFLSFAMFFILIIRPEASMVICRRLIGLSIKDGISGPSAVAFSLYGYALSGQGKLEEGYRFGRLALTFADRFEVWRPRIYFYTYGFTMMWTHPFRDSLEPLGHGQRDAIRYGDLLIYGTSAAFSVFVSFMMGSTLRELQADARSFCESLAEVEQLNPLIFLLPMWSVINELTGVGETLNIVGEIRDTDTVVKYAIKEGVTFLLGYFYTDHAMLYYLLGDFQKSLDMTKKALEYRKRLDFKLTFYDGIATLAKAWTLTPHKRHKCISHGQKIAHVMKNWADRCPENFRNKQLLMYAELAGLNGKPNLAVAFFEESVAIAKKEGFLHEEGIAHERLGHFQVYLGHTSDALLSFNRARRAFETWEAYSVVHRIDKLIASLRPVEVKNVQNTEMGYQ